MARPAKTERNNLIKRLYRKGKTYDELAKEFNLHRSRIGQIITDTSTKTKSLGYTQVAV